MNEMVRLRKPKTTWTAGTVFDDGLVTEKPSDFPSENQIDLCLKWLALYAHPSTSWVRYSSYGYKHIVENWAHEYITNGAFIEAVRRAGYPFRQCEGANNPNAVFKMRVDKSALKWSV